MSRKKKEKKNYGGHLDALTGRICYAHVAIFFNIQKPGVGVEQPQSLSPPSLSFNLV